jgi:predicted transcriptional regulator
MMGETIRIGIMPMEQYKKRTLDIAGGRYSPGKNEPKVWFPSIESALQVLSSRNQELLRVIVEKKPDSLTSLADMTGRSKSNLSRTLRTMERYGLLDIVREKSRIVPLPKATRFNIDIQINAIEDQGR